MENLSHQPRELVVLVLKDIVFRHLEIQSLEDFLVEKYGFNKIKEKEHKISELKQLIPVECREIIFEEESKAPVVLEETEKKLSSLKIYEGTFLESKIGIYILGDTTRREDIVAGTGEEQYTVYTVEYQMIKLISESGYAIQQFIERLTVDLGLEIKSKEWVFHRCREG
jgi:hypothetical protein